MTKPLKIFVIEEHNDVRRALVIRLCAAPGVLIVGEAKAAEAALEEINLLRPDIVLIETKRADGRGLEIVNCIAQGRSGARVIALTSYPTEWERWAVRRAGAAGYFLKDIGSAKLLEQIRNITLLNPSETNPSLPDHLFSR